MDVLSLPEGIFEMILAAGHFSHNEFRDLRLVSKCFARSYAVLSELFHSIHLIAGISIIEWQNSQLLSASGLAPFIRHITFVPPIELPYTFEEYKEVFKSQARLKYGCYEDAEPPRRSGRTQASWESMYDPYLHPEKKLRADFKDYEACAAASLDILEGDLIRKDWTDILRQCARCTSFRFATVDYNLIAMHGLPMVPQCFSGTMIDFKRPRAHCGVEVSAKYTEEFGEMVVALLAAAGCRVEKLVFEQASLHEGLGFWVELGLDRLNYSHLRHLRFEPCLPLYDDDAHEAMSALVQEDITRIFENSSSSLDTFICNRATSLIWKGRETSLPQLRYLIIGGCELSSRFICDWLKAVPMLEQIVIDDIALYDEETHEDEPSGNWKQVFDTMREHPTLAKGALKFTHGGMDDSIEHECGFAKHNIELPQDKLDEIRTVVALELAHAFPGEVDKWIGCYIGGQINWCGALPAYFPA